MVDWFRKKSGGGDHFRSIPVKQINNGKTFPHADNQESARLRVPGRLLRVSGSEGRIFPHPHHSKTQFLRFSSQGIQYQYNRLTFGYSLAPRTFQDVWRRLYSPYTKEE